MDKETLDRVNQPIEYAEFPKMRHHPDGRQVIVNSSKEESDLGAEFLPTPDAALKVRAKRDADEEKRAAAQLAKAKDA